MASDDKPSRGDEIRPEVYDDYDAFLKQAIRQYYERGWKSRKGNFIALVIASGQMASMAKDSVADGSGLKKAAIGAASVVALRFAWRYFLAGPLGMIVGVAALGSAVAYLGKHQKEVTGKIQPYRTLVSETRTRFEEIQGGYRAGRYDQAGRNLMVDGLLQQFLRQVDES
jgi:hypothetical protein